MYIVHRLFTRNQLDLRYNDIATWVLKHLIQPAIRLYVQSVNEAKINEIIRILLLIICVEITAHSTSNGESIFMSWRLHVFMPSIGHIRDADNRLLERDASHWHTFGSLTHRVQSKIYAILQMTFLMNFLQWACLNLKWNNAEFLFQNSQYISIASGIGLVPNEESKTI